MIDNPAYKGEWTPRQIENPAYFEDLEPVKSLGKIVSDTVVGADSRQEGTDDG